MLRFGETKSGKRKMLWCKKKNDTNLACYANNIVISKLIKTKTNSNYLIRYLDDVIRPLVLILPKMSEKIC